VKARAHLLRAIELDPDLADANTGLGLYNYYADTLSAMAKVLRFFMGIPGGNKHEGIRQLEIAVSKGELTAVEARFYLAKNLRNYDHQYARAAALMQPLVAQHPQNPIFLLILGDIEAKLNRREQAANSFGAAEKATVPNGPCKARVQQVARAALTALRAPRSSN
jgi:cytochrome c-type biogenesis protein CcmH/NrfG